MALNKAEKVILRELSRNGSSNWVYETETLSFRAIKNLANAGIIRMKTRLDIINRNCYMVRLQMFNGQPWDDGTEDNNLNTYKG